jgi:hypothetical protein
MSIIKENRRVRIEKFKLSCIHTTRLTYIEIYEKPKMMIWLRRLMNIERGEKDM